MSLLKAHAAGSMGGDQPRRLDRGEAAVHGANPPARGTGDDDLQHLLREAAERARKEGLLRGRQEAESRARAEAATHAKLELAHELKAREAALAHEQAEKWRGLVTALATQITALRAELEAEVTEWTFLAIVRLLGDRPRALVQAAVRQVLEAAQLNEPVTVLLHAEDLPVFEDGGADWSAHVRFAADARVNLGGCLVQTKHQTLDARLEVQLGVLRDLLDAARRGQRES